VTEKGNGVEADGDEVTARLGGGVHIVVSQLARLEL